MKCSTGAPYTRAFLSVLTPLILSTTSGTAQMNTTANSFPTSTVLFEAFKKPPASYRTTPFWVWNDRMTPELVDEGLADLHRHGAGAVFIHPRPGLITPYLSEEWLSLCRHAVRSAGKIGMQVWLYDENSYPSGFAGGHVPANMPDAKRTGLKMTSATELPTSFPAGSVVVLAKDSVGFTDITSHLRTRTFGPGEYRIFTRIYDQPSPWHGGFTYVDLLRPEVTREFINVTMGAYERVLGEEFGRTIPGVFQDEAEIRPPNEPGAQVITYTPALFDAFSTMWGYDLKTSLPCLFEETGEWRTVRHDFFATVLDLFIKGWAKPYFEYCGTHNLTLTGHYWEHEWPRPVMNPDNMACAAYAQMPGIDVLMNEFNMDHHAQFGNARIVREIRSVANQMGYERTLSETYGASGWDLSFADQKRIGDWEYALGVNFLNQHLHYVSLKGARKRDHPPSFSYHEPWWDHYTILAEYFGRLGVALCAGEQINRILVLEPTTTAWMYNRPQWKNSPVDTIGT
ncbi:MAG TPA: glycosyl hydrolase, partial [Bacteroidota bacterium]|nr:glycosyl hydrolase [Bacteroidota bacterium]